MGGFSKRVRRVALEIECWKWEQVLGPSNRIGCGSKSDTQHITLVNGNMGHKLRYPGGLILTHTHVRVVQSKAGFCWSAPFRNLAAFSQAAKPHGNHAVRPSIRKWPGHGCVKSAAFHVSNGSRLAENHRSISRFEQY